MYGFYKKLEHCVTSYEILEKILVKIY